MLGATSLLTLVTLFGLVAGFAREWLLVAHWGAGARTDAFIIAMFLPEAVRTMLAAGVLSSASLSLWQSRTPEQRLTWLGHMTLAFGAISLAFSLLLSVTAPLLVTLMGPGLTVVQKAAAQSALACLVWSLPGLLLQALWAIPLQAKGRFLLAGWGSLLYNLPAVAYLALNRGQSTEPALALAFVGGSVAMALVMVPAITSQGLRLAHLRWSWVPLRELAHRVAPLLGSAGAGQGLMLLERMVASYLGEGLVTVLNLARKLGNLPLIALMSLNQVLLSLMSRAQAQRLALLKGGMATVTIVALPAALGLTLSAPALVALLFPAVQGAQLLTPLLAGYCALLVLAGWITMLARYNYAQGNTRLPMECELWGALAQAVTLVPLAWAFGPMGIVASLFISLAITGCLLVRRNGLTGQLDIAKQALISAVVLAICVQGVMPRLADAPLLRLMESSVVGLLALLCLATWLRPWRLLSGSSSS